MGQTNTSEGRNRGSCDSVSETGVSGKTGQRERDSDCGQVERKTGTEGDRQKTGGKTGHGVREQVDWRERL